MGDGMSKFDLDDKVAIVTGAGGTGHGVGRCIALAFARAGAHVVVVDRDERSVAVVASEVEALGRRSLAVTCDVTVAGQVDDMVETTLATLGRVDILANNVGGTAFSRPEDISPEAWTENIALNLNSTFFCCAAVGKVMIRQQAGKIINIASTSGIKGEENMAHYAAAKAGIINLTKSLAISWSEYGINVNCIAPGRIAVPEHAIDGMSEGEYTKLKAAQVDGAPGLTVPGRPEDIANSAVFFASAASDLISAETLAVRGSEWASVYS